MKVFFIAAPPRSGTSFLAGLLAQNGMWVGETIPGDQDNPTGYYENKKMVEITKRLLKKNGRRARSDSDHIEEYTYHPNLYKAFTRIVGKNEPWLYKDSKLLLCWDLFVECFPEAIWILPQRKASDIVHSLQRCKVWSRRWQREYKTENDFYTMVTALQLEQDHIARAVEHNKIFVNTHRCVKSAEEAKNFVNECGLEFDRNKYEKFRRRDLWHE